MRPTLHENRLYSIAAADEAIATRAMCDASMETSSSRGFSPCLWMNVLCLWVAWIASRFGKQVVKSDQSEQRIQNNLSYTFCSCCWLAECWWRGINSAASCQYRCVDASMNIKQRKRLLQLLNQNNAANIPYDGENREPVQLTTEFFIDEAISYVKEGARLISGALIGGADEHNTSDCGGELEDVTP